MKIRWLGHASFILESSGAKLLTDPFNEQLGYRTCDEKMDIVTISHEHWDHNAVDILAGTPRVVREQDIAEYAGFRIEGVKSYHDKKEGLIRGSNSIYKIMAEDLKIVHLGDLGHVLTDAQVKEIGAVDILLVPVGGTYTLDADDAYKVVKQLKPNITIPMHFLTNDVKLRELAPVEAFTTKFSRVVKKPYLEITSAQLGQESQIIVLDYPC